MDHSTQQTEPADHVGVFLSYASSRGHTLLDRELYLPKSWTDDKKRCQEAHVPEGVTFALSMLTLAFLTALRAHGEENILKKSLSS
jgi:SRSO17 transposase